MKIFLTIILAIGFCFAEEPAKPLPKDVQTIVDSREAELQAARIAFDKAVFEANKKAIGKMEVVVKTSTQKGDLDGALASKKFVEDWNKEKEAVAVSSGMGGAGPKGDDLSKLIGKVWQYARIDGEYVKLNKDGSLMVWWANKPFSIKNTPDSYGNWKKSKDTIVIIFDGRNWIVKGFEGDLLNSIDSRGTEFSLKLIQ